MTEQVFFGMDLGFAPSGGDVDLRSDRLVLCEGGCGRGVGGRERGVHSYLCAPCTSKQAKRVRTEVIAQVAKQKADGLARLLDSYERSMIANPNGIRRVSRAELEAQYAR